MKAFSFPSGPNSISKEELELAFSKFEKVEIPGSVFRLECNFDDMESPQGAKLPLWLLGFLY